MAVVQGVKEKVHLPIYDCLTIKPGQQWREVERNSVIKFFIDVQDKTKLETNLQSASLLPHYNTFEARAMRVVISDLPPTFSEDVDIEITGTPAKPALKTDMKRAGELLEDARSDADGEVTVSVDTNGEEDGENNPVDVTFTARDIEDAISSLDDDKEIPPLEQLRPNNGAGTLIGKLVYNTVTTLFVGEKEMIRMPTWFFPAGAGPYSETGSFSTHGEPTPVATFRFAEPIFIDKQQNFRVELEIPDNETLLEVQRIYGPMRVWVVLDGYMTRDVQ